MEEGESVSAVSYHTEVQQRPYNFGDVFLFPIRDILTSTARTRTSCLSRCGGRTSPGLAFHVPRNSVFAAPFSKRGRDSVLQTSSGTNLETAVKRPISLEEEKTILGFIVDGYRESYGAMTSSTHIDSNENKPKNYDDERIHSTQHPALQTAIYLAKQRNIFGIRDNLCRCVISIPGLFSSPYHVITPAERDLLDIVNKKSAPPARKVWETVPLFPCEVHQLTRALPYQYQKCCWIRAFDTDIEGYSLSHCFRTIDEFRKKMSDELCFADIGNMPCIGLLEVAPRCETKEDGKAYPSDEIPSETVENSQKHHHISSFFGAKGLSRAGHSLGTSCSIPHYIKESAPCSQARRDREVIGVFSTELPTLDYGPHHFLGSKENFVFTFRTHSYDSTAEDTNSNRSFHVYPASHRNNEFMICANDFLCIGGGCDGAAICLYGDQGSTSAHCQTFDSPALCGAPIPSSVKSTPASKILSNSSSAALRQNEFTVLRMQWFVLDSQHFIPSLLQLQINDKKKTSGYYLPIEYDPDSDCRPLCGCDRKGKDATHSCSF
eukprot:Tbor_TRINITY_DN4044_c0_g1::TRINITY_DN4044_c0_g1_i1::g.11858::m.11858